MTDFEGDPDPESLANTFLYTEKREPSSLDPSSHTDDSLPLVMYLPHSYFVTDHKQAWREEPASMLPDALVPLIDDGTPETAWAIEEDKRWRMRRELFPTLAPDVFIFACWNQLYKVSISVCTVCESRLTGERPPDRSLLFPTLAQHPHGAPQVDPLAPPLSETGRVAPPQDRDRVGGIRSRGSHLLYRRRSQGPTHPPRSSR
jgi:hypothetical protein